MVDVPALSCHEYSVIDRDGCLSLRYVMHQVDDILSCGHFDMKFINSTKMIRARAQFLR